MNISTGWFTVPVDGSYFFAWQGPNGEDLSPKSFPTLVNINHNPLSNSPYPHSLAFSGDTDLRTEYVQQLKKGDTLSLVFGGPVGIRSPIKYQRAIAFLIGCDASIKRAAAEVFKLKTY